ncbi:MAG: aminoacyl-histidine dipeptidase [Prolixibacteraceae bacterium]|nr:aminoacyl-histidine dipeptidase [Prolixibacteraceae bacterium]
MERKISHLQPVAVWGNFEDICMVPRPSKKEGKIIAFLEEFARKNDLDFKKDEVGNILIIRNASPGFETKPVIILQTHMDMVCEKNSDVVHDFDNDTIKPYVDGEWVTAGVTTLGADCGVGMAAQLALLTDKDLKAGKIECLFTVDEETGLTGAFAMKAGFLSGSILLNLDSEDEGTLYIGCAGGADTVADFGYIRKEVPKNFFPVKIKISGLMGGHSGGDIHEGRGNANKILARFLFQSLNKYDLKLSSISGGNLRNVIAREAEAVVLIPSDKKESLVVDFNIYKSDITNEIGRLEKELKMDLGTTDMPDFVIDEDCTKRLINSLFICPHGVQAMSLRMPGIVETSTNLASVKMNDGNIIQVTTSQRSEIESAKFNICNIVESIFVNAGAVVRHSDGYPGWTPEPDSEILKHTVNSYIKLFGNEPIVKSIHAGLECGLFKEKYPHLDMVSFGPTITGAHSPAERIEISTVEKFWRLLLDVVSNV